LLLLSDNLSRESITQSIIPYRIYIYNCTRVHSATSAMPLQFFCVSGEPVRLHPMKIDSTSSSHSDLIFKSNLDHYAIASKSQNLI